MPSLDVDVGAVHDDFVRHIPHGATPLYQPPHPADGRWRHGDVIEAWYFADEPPTAWAEWYGALAGTGLPPARAVPRDLVVFRTEREVTGCRPLPPPTEIADAPPVPSGMRT